MANSPLMMLGLVGITFILCLSAMPMVISLTGATGPMGPQGPIGAQGDIGPQGPVGNFVNGTNAEINRLYLNELYFDIENRDVKLYYPISGNQLNIITQTLRIQDSDNYSSLYITNDSGDVSLTLEPNPTSTGTSSIYLKDDNGDVITYLRSDASQFGTYVSMMDTVEFFASPYFNEDLFFGGVGSLTWGDDGLELRNYGEHTGINFYIDDENALSINADSEVTFSKKVTMESFSVIQDTLYIGPGRGYLTWDAIGIQLNGINGNGMNLYVTGGEPSLSINATYPYNIKLDTATGGVIKLNGIVDIGAHKLKTSSLYFEEGIFDWYMSIKASNGDLRDLLLRNLYPNACIVFQSSGMGILTPNGNTTFVIIGASKGGIYKEVAKIQSSSSDPFFSIGGNEEFRFYNSGVATLSGTVNMPYYSGDYGVLWDTSMPNPSGTVNGGMMVVYNSNAGILSSRIYIYSNGAWHYVGVT